MGKTGIKLLVLGFSLAAISEARPQYVVTYAKPQRADGLRGHVVDPTGGIVDGAKVSIISCPVTQGYPDPPPVFRAETMTDAHGEFYFVGPKISGPYCLRVFRPGFNPTEMQLKISRFANELRITLTIAA